jgi:hypothetical protein
MKNLVLTALVLGTASLTGACVAADNGTITATWQLQDWNDTTETAVTAPCPTGGDTAILYSLSAGDTNTANALKDLFNCTDGVGTASVPVDDYTTWIEITDHTGNTLYAQSGSQPVSVALNLDSTPAAPFAFQVNRGYIHASWTLSGITCPQIDAVEYNSTGPNAFLISDTFTCADAQGTTFPAPLFNYNLAIQGLNPAKAAVTTTGNVPANVTFGNQQVEAGAVVLTGL